MLLAKKNSNFMHGFKSAILAIFQINFLTSFSFKKLTKGIRYKTIHEKWIDKMQVLSKIRRTRYLGRICSEVALSYNSNWYIIQPICLTLISKWAQARCETAEHQVLCIWGHNNQGTKSKTTASFSKPGLALQLVQAPLDCRILTQLLDVMSRYVVVHCQL